MLTSLITTTAPVTNLITVHASLRTCKKTNRSDTFFHPPLPLTAIMTGRLTLLPFFDKSQNVTFAKFDVISIQVHVPALRSLVM